MRRHQDTHIFIIAICEPFCILFDVFSKNSNTELKGVQQNIPWMVDRNIWWKTKNKWLIGAIDKKYVKPTQNNPCVENGKRYEYRENKKNAVKPSDWKQSFQKTWQECQALCAETPECKFWSWAGLQNVPWHHAVKTECLMGRWKSKPSGHNSYQQNKRIDYAISGPKYCPKVKLLC